MQKLEPQRCQTNGIRGYQGGGNYIIPQKVMEEDDTGRRGEYLDCSTVYVKIYESYKKDLRNRELKAGITYVALAMQLAAQAQARMHRVVRNSSLPCPW